MKITVANNYQLDVVARLCREGAWPAEHLWGTQFLQSLGHEVTVTPWAPDVFRAPPGSLEARLPGVVRELTGPVAYQVAVLRHGLASDVIYSAHAATTQGIVLLKSLGAFRTPVIGVVRPEYRHSRSAARSVRSLDVAVCLSEVTASRVRQLAGMPSDRVRVLRWGPDLTFSEYNRPPGGSGVVSSGRSRRDLKTLLAAANRMPSVPFKVYGKGDESALGGHIEMRTATGYRDVLADIAASAVVAIPLPHDRGEPTGTTGLSELNAAMALGKPVIMTRSPYIDIDIDAEGFGILVEAYDVDGWERAIRDLSENPEAAREMGRRGRQFVERSWNATHFAQGIASILDAL